MKKVILFLCICSLLVALIGCGTNQKQVYWNEVQDYFDQFNELRTEMETLTTQMSTNLDQYGVSKAEQLEEDAVDPLGELKDIKPPEEYEEFHDELVKSYEGLKEACGYMSDGIREYISGFESAIPTMKKALASTEDYMSHWKKVGELKPDPEDLE